jgi:hypothetical protein
MTRRRPRRRPRPENAKPARPRDPTAGLPARPCLFVQERRSTETALEARRGPGDITTPPWAPAGSDLSHVPDEIRLAVAELIQPFYEEHVGASDDPIERSLGMTVAHLLWLEILEQFDQKRQYTQIESVLGIPGDRQAIIDRHLRLIGTKVRVGEFLLRMRDRRARLGEPQRRIATALPESMDAAPARLADDRTSAARRPAKGGRKREVRTPARAKAVGRSMSEKRGVR